MLLKNGFIVAESGEYTGDLRCEGEFGSAVSGCCASRSINSRINRSYSKSLIVGAFST